MKKSHLLHMLSVGLLAAFMATSVKAAFVTTSVSVTFDWSSLRWESEATGSGDAPIVYWASKQSATVVALIS
jgi:hypothetical protein